MSHTRLDDFGREPEKLGSSFCYVQQQTFLLNLCGNEVPWNSLKQLFCEEIVKDSHTGQPNIIISL